MNIYNIILLIFFLTRICIGNDKVNQQASERLHNCQITLGYWNDNVDWENYIVDKMRLGLDDYVTASFWLNESFSAKNQHWLIDIYLHIITNRPSGYRLDLLSGGLSTIKNDHLGSFKICLGLISSGDYGGSDIQNAYHDFAGIIRLNLPYANKTRTGPYLTISYFSPNLKFYGITLEPYIIDLNSLSVGINSFKFGNTLKTRQFLLTKYCQFHTTLLICYSIYHNLSEALDPIFEGGFSYGGMISAQIAEEFGVSAWIISNQYHNDQGHCGILFTLGSKNFNLPEFVEIMFP
jgi:hypothetical protein